MTKTSGTKVITTQKLTDCKSFHFGLYTIDKYWS